MTARTKSVCASGTLSFNTPSPMPLPVNPPCFIDSKAFWVCKLSPLLGSIKVFNLLKIYENLSLNNSNVDDMPTKIARPKEIRRAILIPETNIKINQTEKINKLWPTSGWLSNNNKEKNSTQKE